MTVKEGFLFLHAFSVLPLDMGILETDQLSLSFLQSTRMWTSVISMYPENIWWHKKEKPENSITWYKVSPSVVHVTRVIKWNYCRRYTGKLLFFMPIYLFDRSESKFESHRIISRLSHCCLKPGLTTGHALLFQLYLSSTYSTCQVLWIYGAEHFFGERETLIKLTLIKYNCKFRWVLGKKAIWYHESI